MLRPLLRHVLGGGRAADLEAAPGYDLWSSTYDEEKNNVLVALDERLFEGLLRRVDLRGKRIVDVGCGTGRHWKALLAGEPAAMVGYDVSSGMLDVLRRKYPHATVHQASADRLVHAEDGGTDVVLSTLALCHVAELDAAIDEWCRVLRPGGDLVLTDFHPAAAAALQCSFRHRGKTFTVELHPHTLAALEAAATRNRLELLHRAEAIVDGSTRHHFEQAGMLREFERRNGRPLVHGAHFRKPSGAGR
jgi:ubiquinone/menaquinone biosynthesis C-methylase UbiE